MLSNESGKEAFRRFRKRKPSAGIYAVRSIVPMPPRDRKWMHHSMREKP